MQDNFGLIFRTLHEIPPHAKRFPLPMRMVIPNNLAAPWSEETLRITTCCEFKQHFEFHNRSQESSRATLPNSMCLSVSFPCILLDGFCVATSRERNASLHSESQEMGLQTSVWKPVSSPRKNLLTSWIRSREHLLSELNLEKMKLQSQIKKTS